MDDGKSRAQTMPVVRMSDKEFDGLLEYSLSLPTGTTIGKRWKRHVGQRGHGGCGVGMACGHWQLGEYYDIGSKTHVGIRWSRLLPLVRDVPVKPEAWRPEVD